MSVAVVYWSQTGNTEAMANILAGAAGTEAISWDDFSANQVVGYDEPRTELVQSRERRANRQQAFCRQLPSRLCTV